MLRKISLLIPFLALSMFSSSIFAHGFKKPEQAVSSYIKAVKTGSGKHITMAFSDTAVIQYYNPKGEYKHYTRDVFADLVNTGKTWDAVIKVTELKNTGNAANATVEFTWGENNEHGYVDYLNLIYDGKSWHITNKVAQYIER